MNALSSTSIALFCWVYGILINSSMEAFSDMRGEIGMPSVLTYVDAFSPMMVTSCCLGILVGLIWWLDSSSRTKSFELVVSVIAFLLSAVALIGSITILSQFTYMNGLREVPWYRYVTNVIMIALLGWALWKAKGKNVAEQVAASDR